MATVSYTTRTVEVPEFSLDATLKARGVVAIISDTFNVPRDAESLLFSNLGSYLGWCLAAKKDPFDLVSKNMKAFGPMLKVTLPFPDVLEEDEETIDEYFAAVLDDLGIEGQPFRNQYLENILLGLLAPLAHGVPVWKRPTPDLKLVVGS